MTIATAVRVSSTGPRPVRAPSRGRKFARRDRVEAGIIIAAFALAFAFFGSQTSAAAPELTWNTEQATSVNQQLQIGTWVPLGTPADLSADQIYRFCVTTMGAGTMLMEPSQLISPVTLAGGAPVTTCADTHDLAGATSVLPTVTIADSTSNITVVESSWQRLEIGGE
jgi:hypothetical protein